MIEARRLEQQQDIVEAIWCYETILRDPLASENPTIGQTACLGLGRLLVSEATSGLEPDRTLRLLNRAVSVLSRQCQPSQPMRAVLAEAHVLLYEIKHDPRDLLGANIQLALLDQAGSADRETAGKVRHLRDRLTRSS